MATEASSTVQPEVTPMVEPVPTTGVETMTPMPDTATKKKFPFKLVGCIVLVFLVLTCCAVSLVIAYPTLKNNFVPGLSPLVEDFVATPNEQLANRIAPNFKQASEQLDALNSSKDLNDYMNNMKTDPAQKNTAIDADFAMKMTMPASTSSYSSSANGSFELKGNLNAKTNSEDKDNPEAQADMDVSYDYGGVTLKGSLTMQTFKNKYYLKLNSLPDLGSLLGGADLSKATGKWYSITPSDAAIKIPASDDKKIKEQVAKYKDYLAKAQQVFYTPSLAKNVKIAGEENFHNMTLKCYLVSFDKDSLFDFITDVNALLDEKDRAKVTRNDLKGLKTLDIKLCFDKNSSVIYKESFNIESEAEGSQGAGTFTMNLSQYPLTEKFDISEPTDAKDINKLYTDLTPTKKINVVTLSPELSPEFDY